jgi:hypothetical protein
MSCASFPRFRPLPALFTFTFTSLVVIARGSRILRRLGRLPTAGLSRRDKRPVISCQQLRVVEDFLHILEGSLIF